MSEKRKPGPPPNLAARSLADVRHRIRVVRSRKSYSRKTKHKNRDHDPGSFGSGVRRWRNAHCAI